LSQNSINNQVKPPIFVVEGASNFETNSPSPNTSNPLKGSSISRDVPRHPSIQLPDHNQRKGSLVELGNPSSQISLGTSGSSLTDGASSRALKNATVEGHLLAPVDIKRKKRVLSGRHLVSRPSSGISTSQSNISSENTKQRDSSALSVEEAETLLFSRIPSLYTENLKKTKPAAENAAQTRWNAAIQSILR
jgi:hypothetical protein